MHYRHGSGNLTRENYDTTATPGCIWACQLQEQRYKRHLMWMKYLRLPNLSSSGGLHAGCALGTVTL